MSFESTASTLMTAELPQIEVEGVGKTYRLFRRPLDRLLQMIRPAPHRCQHFVALEDVSFAIRRGEVLGIVGVNGAGKSTLMQIVAGTITPSTGRVITRGRVASILELGAGFNPDFSGRENIYLNAATMGLSKREIEQRLDAIIAFAGIGEHIEQPVKTYSSGMLVRLAFSIASSVEPDILIIDEALSVGDGAFRRRSFDRIMEIKARGTTILFCSHVLFHVETFCDRAIWIHRGRVQKAGAVSEVLEPYQAFLDMYEHNPSVAPDEMNIAAIQPQEAPPMPAGPQGSARFEHLEIFIDGHCGSELSARALRSRLSIKLRFASDPALPAPSVALVISSESGKLLASCSSLTGGLLVARNPQGQGEVSIDLPALPLNRGCYRIGVYLFCERGLHGYAMLDPAATVKVDHDGLEQGHWIMQPHWSTQALA